MDTYFVDLGIVMSLISSVKKFIKEQRGQESGKGHENIISRLHLGDDMHS